MVLGVCQRLLADAHLAEDAFQATFLVLIRKAAAIRRPRLLANWLYGVAQRTALRARRPAARRGSQLKLEIDMLAAPEAERVWHDLRPVLDEELNRLPEKYRLPILLCYIQGRTNEEAAKQLGWPKGTVSGRLARARELLRGRLGRRGVTLSAAAVATAASQNAAATVPPALVNGLVQAAGGPVIIGGVVSPFAIALSKGVLNAMFLKTLKNAVTGLLLAIVISIGAAVLALNLYAGLREHVPVTVAGLVPINEAEGLEAQVLKAQKANRAKFTRGVLHWTFTTRWMASRNQIRSTRRTGSSSSGGTAIGSPPATGTTRRSWTRSASSASDARANAPPGTASSFAVPPMSSRSQALRPCSNTCKRAGSP